MPKPDEWHHHDVDPPTSDNDYFERMSRVIFMSGLNWVTLDKKWPGIKDAFRGFDIDTVAGLGEPDVEELMQNPAVIRNRSKIQAVITNAREFQAIIDESGSFANYIQELRGQGEAAMRDSIAKRFAFMGKGTTVIFLFSIGEQLPEATAEWESRHQAK